MIIALSIPVRYVDPEGLETCAANMVSDARSDLEGKDSLLELLHSEDHETISKFSDLVNYSKCDKIPYPDLV